MDAALLALELLSGAVASYYGANLLFVVGGNALSRRAAKLRPMSPAQAELFGAVEAGALARLRGVFVETWCQTRVLHADFTRHLRGRPTLAPLDRGTPVLLLPGYLETTGAMSLLGRWLRAQGFRVVLDEFPSTFQPIAANARYVHERVQAIRAETGAEAVAVVAHSMGGVVARSMIHGNPGEHGVRVLVCFGSPHQGITFRAMAPGHSARDMMATSEHTRVLAERASAGVPVHTIVAIQEQVVTPPWVTMTDEGETLVLDEALGHFGPMFSTHSRAQLEAWLLEAGVERGETPEP